MEQEVLRYRVGTDKHGVRTPHTPVMALGGVILVLLPGGLCACVCVYVSVFSFLAILLLLRSLFLLPIGVVLLLFRHTPLWV